MAKNVEPVKIAVIGGSGLYEMAGLEKMDRYPFRVYTSRNNKPNVPMMSMCSMRKSIRAFLFSISLTHEYEQFITSPAGNYYEYTAYPNRLDYYSTSNYLAFGSIDVNGPSFTVNLYHVGSTAPTLEWSKTFTKSGVERPMKYYGVDRGSPFTDANYATLAQHAVKTIIVDTFIFFSCTMTILLCSIAHTINLSFFVA